jgi:hypothetical protein
MNSPKPIPVRVAYSVVMSYFPYKYKKTMLVATLNVSRKEDTFFQGILFIVWHNFDGLREDSDGVKDNDSCRLRDRIGDT